MGRHPPGARPRGAAGSGSVDVEKQHQFDSYVGAGAVAIDGALVVAEHHTLTRIALDGSRSSGSDLFTDHPDDRWNDGVCDARGRFLVGTCSLTGARHSQRLLRTDGDTTTVLDDDLGLANGMAFSPDDSLFYSIDSLPDRRVWVRDYDQEKRGRGTTTLGTGDHGCGARRPVPRLFGNLWLAAWGQGEVRCYSPDGEVLNIIELPAPATTSLAFVGPSSTSC